MAGKPRPSGPALFLDSFPGPAKDNFQRRACVARVRCSPRGGACRNPVGDRLLRRWKRAFILLANYYDAAATQRLKEPPPPGASAVPAYLSEGPCTRPALTATGDTRPETRDVPLLWTHLGNPILLLVSTSQITKSDTSPLRNISSRRGNHCCGRCTDALVVGFSNNCEYLSAIRPVTSLDQSFPGNEPGCHDSRTHGEVDSKHV